MTRNALAYLQLYLRLYLIPISLKSHLYQWLVNIDIPVFSEYSLSIGPVLPNIGSVLTSSDPRAPPQGIQYW